MKDLIYMLMADFKTQVVFLHVISAVIWVGGMIAMRFAAHHSFLHLEKPLFRMERVAHALKRLFYLVTPFVLILIITAVIMAVGLGFRAAAVDASGNVIDDTAMFLYNLVHLKEVIWMIMAANLGLMMLFRNKAERALAVNDAETAKSKLGLIGKYMVPLNIILGIIAIFLGTYLSSSI